jgi:hypothetical protein
MNEMPNPAVERIETPRRRISVQHLRQMAPSIAKMPDLTAGMVFVP